jgi:3-oxoacyl-[acyl-carrier-protein] synthase II
VTGLAVLATALHVPGRDDAVPAAEAKKVLGRKGLLGKEPATLLALCAVHRMFGLPPGRPAESVSADTAVLVASNLGNVATVCSIVDSVRAEGTKGVSPLDAPNASSNVIASTIAIWYGLTGPNIAVCSGATAGLDAVRLASLLLRTGRAARALVVGVEPADEIATGIAGEVVEGAASVLLGLSDEPGPSLGPVRDVDGIDAADQFTGLYGAAGVARVAHACASRVPATVGCGDAADGYLAVDVSHG